MSTQDHFNWPMPNRNETMYLSTLPNKDSSAGFVQKPFYKDRSSNLDIRDIDKAQPYYYGTQYLQKETFANRNDDIEGSRPKRLHQPLEKEYYDLRNEDIKGSKPKCNKFTTTRIGSNPLNPEYRLPQVEIRQSTPPKFVRDNIDIKDIDGARPNPYNKYNIVRTTNVVADIDGARPKKEWIPQGKPSSLNVKDINNYFEFNSKRQTDPLSPRYKLADEKNQVYEYGDLDNKPFVRHPKEVNKVTSFDLRTEDIKGAQAGTATSHINKLATRDNLMKTQDIPGAQISTLKKGMTTKRQSNPLWPDYKVPGHSEPDPYYTRNVHPTASTSKYSEFVTGFGTKPAATQYGVTGVMPAETRTEQPALTGLANIGGDDRARKSITETLGNTGNVGYLRRESGTDGNVKGLGTQNSYSAKTTPLLRSGEEVVNAGVTAKSEYVPARMPGEGYYDAGKSKSGATSAFENKKLQNSSDSYQKNVKNFFGVSGGDDAKSFKTKSVLERFDQYLAK